jgi:hypothetical protein
MLGTRRHTQSVTESSYSGSISPQLEVSQTAGGKSATSQSSMHTGRSNKKPRKGKLRKAATDSGMTDTPRNDVGEEGPVLFLSLYTGSNESIARTVVPGTTDQSTFECLFEAYRSISWGWFKLKRVTAIKFFRVRSKGI